MEHKHKMLNSEQQRCPPPPTHTHTPPLESCGPGSSVHAAPNGLRQWRVFLTASAAQAEHDATELSTASRGKPLCLSLSSSDLVTNESNETGWESRGRALCLCLCLRADVTGRTGSGLWRGWRWWWGGLGRRGAENLVETT